MKPAILSNGMCEPVWSGEYFLVLRQTKGKYGSFNCQFCGGRAEWTFSRSSGYCDVCHASLYQLGEGIVHRDVEKLSFVTAWFSDHSSFPPPPPIKSGDDECGDVF